MARFPLYPPQPNPREICFLFRLCQHALITSLVQRPDMVACNLIIPEDLSPWNAITRKFRVLYAVQCIGGVEREGHSGLM